MFGVVACCEGRVTRDPELKETRSGLPMLSLSLAVDEPVKAGEEKRTTFINVRVFGDRAKEAADTFVKSDRCYAEGRLTLDNWVTQSGETRTGLSLLASKCVPIGKIGRRAKAGKRQNCRNPDDLRRGAEAQRPLHRDDFHNDGIGF